MTGDDRWWQVMTGDSKSDNSGGRSKRWGIRCLRSIGILTRQEILWQSLIRFGPWSKADCTGQPPVQKLSSLSLKKTVDLSHQGLCHWGAHTGVVFNAIGVKRSAHDVRATLTTAATTTETGAEAFRQHWAKRYGFKSGWWKMVERYETALEKNPPHADCESAGHPKRFFFLCDIADAACGKKDALPRSSAMIQRLGVRRQSEVNPGWMMMMMMMMMKIVLLVISQAPSRCLVRSWYCVARSHSAFTGWYVEARFAQRKDMTARCKGLGWGDQQIKL